MIDGTQLKRISERLRPQLAAERSRLATAQPDAGLADFTGSGAAETWNAADVEARKRVIRLLGLLIAIHPVGAGNGREYAPDSVTIEAA